MAVVALTFGWRKIPTGTSGMRETVRRLTCTSRNWHRLRAMLELYREKVRTVMAVRLTYPSWIHLYEIP